MTELERHRLYTPRIAHAHDGTSLVYSMQAVLQDVERARAFYEQIVDGSGGNR